MCTCVRACVCAWMCVHACASACLEVRGQLVEVDWGLLGFAAGT